MAGNFLTTLGQLRRDHLLSQIDHSPPSRVDSPMQSFIVVFVPIDEEGADGS